MIGYYVHHQGNGHLHRAMTVAPHLPEPVTGFSSLPRPESWTVTTAPRPTVPRTSRHTAGCTGRRSPTPA